MARPTVIRQSDKYSFSVVDFDGHFDILEITTLVGTGVVTSSRYFFKPEDMHALKAAIDVALLAPRPPR